MKSTIKSIFFLLIAIQVSGCALGGIAKMQKTDFIEKFEPDKVLVNFVRPKVFAGDGVNVDMWDGDKFIGTLGAGKMIQYITTPGEHIFMASAQGLWGIAKGDLIAGKKYYLKYNNGFGFIVLGVAKSSDPRIEKWNTSLSPVSINKSNSPLPVSEKHTKKAQAILERMEEGTAKYNLISEENAI